MSRLLLVEDAPDVAFLATRLARRLGIEVLHATDVASAWESLRAVPPDLLLLDINLPGERGEDLCRRLRAAPATARLPVALFVAWSCPADVVAGLEAGADYVLAKDLLVRPEAWQARLAEILAAGDGLTQPASISCQQNDLLPEPPPAVLEALNLALRHPLTRQLGSDVVRLVLRRAVNRAGADRWLQEDGMALDVPFVARTASGEAVAAFAAAVTEQWQRLLGAEASGPVREALAAAVARLSG
jgi:CheY-like chemotaxis protein